MIVRRAVAFDLGVLGVFKYYGFFAQDVGRVLDAVQLGLPLPLLSLVLPVGISFFTFQAISYTVDVSRRVIAPARTLDVAIYLSLLPAPRGRADRAGAGVPAPARRRRATRTTSRSGPACP